MARLRDLMIGVSVFAAIFIGMFLFSSSLAEKAGGGGNLTGISGQNDSISTIAADIQANSKESSQALTDQTITGVALIDTPIIMATGAYSIIKNTIYTGTTVFTRLIGAVAVQMHLPDWFTAFILAVIGMFLVFEVIQVVSGKEV